MIKKAMAFAECPLCERSLPITNVARRKGTLTVKQVAQALDANVGRLRICPCGMPVRNGTLHICANVDGDNLVDIEMLECQDELSISIVDALDAGWATA